MKMQPFSLTPSPTTHSCFLLLIQMQLSLIAMHILGGIPSVHVLPVALAESHAESSLISRSPGTKHGSRIVGYPGVLSREYVQSRVEQELRSMILNWSGSTDNTSGAFGNSLNVTKDTTNANNHRHNHPRTLKKDKDDFSGLNDILESFNFELPEQIIEQPLLGATATFVINGQCGDISVDKIDLDYDIDKDDLAYDVEVEGLDVDCEFDVQFDFGVYDIEDDLTIDVALRDNDFRIGVVLEGVPPETSSFQGCEASIGLKDIDANGGFSANILNDLDYLLVDIVDSETEAISDILCEQVTQFTSLVDGILVSVVELLEPYLGEPKSVDPLQLEKDLQTDEELVDFTDSDLGYAITVIVNNLEGVVGPYQINTLIELNLLDEDGSFVVDFTQEDGEADDEDDSHDSDDDDRRQLQALSDECALLRRRSLVESILASKDLLGRRLQFGEGEDELFTVNSLDILSIEVRGLNTIDDVDLLEIIGKHTFRTKVEVSAIFVKATLFLDADINGVNIEETIEVTVPIEDIEVVISYLVGLKATVVENTGLGTLLGTDNLVGCFYSALQAFGISELSVSVGQLGTPTVQGVLDSGVDELINTAVEAAVIAYQELIVEEAIPNIFQQNVTAAVNEFAECTIRAESATAVCPTGEAAEQDDDAFIDGFFRRLQQMPAFSSL